MPPNDRCTPRVKNGVATRQLILNAATVLFSQQSYEEVGVREIAADAGVDVALVNRYFGTKKALFIEVLRNCDALIYLPPSELPTHFAMAISDERCIDERWLLIILRSASSPEANAIVRESLCQGALFPLHKVLDGCDVELRAALLIALWTGVIVLRDIMKVEALSNGDIEQRRLRIARMLCVALAAGDDNTASAF